MSDFQPTSELPRNYADEGYEPTITITKLKEEGILLPSKNLQVSYISTRDPNKLIVNSDIFSSMQIPCVIFDVDSMTIGQPKGSQLEITQIIPKGWKLQMPHLANPDYASPEQHETIQTICKLQPFNSTTDHVVGRILAGPINKTILDKRTNKDIRKFAELYPTITLWNVIFARGLVQTGHPGDESTLEKFISIIEQRKETVVKLMREAGNESQILELVNSPLEIK